MKTKRFALFVLVAMLVCLPSCAKQTTTTPDEEPIDDPIDIVDTEPDVTPEPDSEEPEFVSPFTGLEVSEDKVNSRPVAIMVNNLKRAQPQLGLNDADIVYEALAEGGITRMLAVFGDISSAGNIGSIRSSRPYYIDFADGLDAIYMHMGGSPQAYAILQNRADLDSADLGYGINVAAVWQDPQRKTNMGYEHSWITSGEKLAALLETKGLRTTVADDYDSGLVFGEDSPVSDGTATTHIEAIFSPYKTGTYDYDAATGKYLLGQYGGIHVDGNTSEQLAFDNLFILRIEEHIIAGDTAGRLEYSHIGTGKGYYFCDGKMIPITWEKTAYDSPFRFYDSTGADLVITPGRSYFAIVPLNATVNY